MVTRISCRRIIQLIFGGTTLFTGQVNQVRDVWKSKTNKVIDKWGKKKRDQRLSKKD